MRRFMISLCLKKGIAALALTLIPLVSIAHAGEPVGGEIMGDFYVEDAGLPTAHVFTVLPKPENVLTPTKLQSVLGDLAGEGGDAEDAFEVGFNKANLALGVSSSVFSVADGVGAMTGASFFDGLKFDLGQAFTYAGYLSVAVQAVVDIRSGDERRLAVNLYKNISNIGVNLVAAGNVALSVALAGVFAIDITLNWFGEESVNLRLDKGRQAYIAYMEDVRSDSEWRDFVYNRTESLAKEGRIDKLPGVLEDELRRLMEGFWTTSEADVILKAGGRRHSVMQRSERQRITRDVELRIKRTLAEMVEELEAKQFQQLWRAYVAEVEKQKTLLNTKLRLTVREEVKEDEEPTMAGCRVRLGKLKSGVPQGAWEFTLDESGEGYLDMTLLGYLQAGMPTSVEVISPEKDGREKQDVRTKQAFQLIGQNTLVAVTPQADDIIVIYTAKQLDDMHNGLDKHYRLGADIDLTDYIKDAKGWIPIGWHKPAGRANYTTSTEFTGSLDGDGYKITGFWINRDQNNVGLFGKVEGATIQNLSIEIADKGVTGRMYVGGLVGYARNVNISNCHVTGNVTGTYYPDSNAGGLAGILYGQSKVMNCGVVGNVTGKGNGVGGLAGSVSGEKVSVANCYFEGKVTGDVNYVGGLTGILRGKAKYCYAAGSVTGKSIVGGLTGNVWSGAELANSFAMCEVAGSGDAIGDLTGGASEGTIVNSRALTRTARPGKKTFTDNGWTFYPESVEGPWYWKDGQYPQLKK